MEQRKGIQIKDYLSLIQGHAQVALSKVKKPSCYDFEDLFQEGVFVFINSRNHYKEDSPACFKTYLITCLRNHFCFLVKKTYRSINHLNGFEKNFLETIHGTSSTETIEITISHHNFNITETRYIMFLLHIPKKVQREFKECKR